MLTGARLRAYWDLVGLFLLLSEPTSAVAQASLGVQHVDRRIVFWSQVAVFFMGVQGLLLRSSCGGGCMNESRVDDRGKASMRLC